MSRPALFFDEVRHRAEQVLDEVELLADMPRVYLVRSLFGRLGVAVPASARATCGEPCRQVLDRLASALRDRLGAYARADDGAVLWVDDVEDSKKTGRFWPRDWCFAVRSITLWPFYVTLLVVPLAGLWFVRVTGGGV